ncbi:MAG TPA: ACP phosphodiesterase [Bacteroidales bacterium]|nr:ACP phosphodiesterase [Bacteroidales bacterium]HNS46907.1 ACP phosphodiesterase [Bacteroidales bacterium]
MNFLAHAFLSGERPDILVGNFIADHIPGNAFDHYREEIVQGIQLHRRIDSFTDHHPVYLRSKRRLYRNQHKYAGVVADMFYDHFLATGWSAYSFQDLTEFTARSYAILMQNFDILPARTKRILPYMMEDDWLASYANLDFLQQSLRGMAIRTPYRSGMEKAVSDLRDHYDSFRDEFREFFPELILYARQEIEKITGIDSGTSPGP